MPERVRPGAPYLRRGGRSFLPVGAHLVPPEGPDWPWRVGPEAFDRGFAAMAAAGMTAVRIDLAWAAVEPAEGRYDEGHLRVLDEILAAAGRHGLLLHPALLMGGEVGDAFWDVPWRAGRHPHRDAGLVASQAAHAGMLARRWAGDSAAASPGTSPTSRRSGRSGTRPTPRPGPGPARSPAPSGRPTRAPWSRSGRPARRSPGVRSGRTSSPTSWTSPASTPTRSTTRPSSRTACSARGRRTRPPSRRRSPPAPAVPSWSTSTGPRRRSSTPSGSPRTIACWPGRASAAARRASSPGAGPTPSPPRTGAPPTSGPRTRRSSASSTRRARRGPAATCWPELAATVARLDLDGLAADAARRRGGDRGAPRVRPPLRRGRLRAGRRAVRALRAGRDRLDAGARPGPAGRGVAERVRARGPGRAGRVVPARAPGRDLAGRPAGPAAGAARQHRGQPARADDVLGRRRGPLRPRRQRLGGLLRRHGHPGDGAGAGGVARGPGAGGGPAGPPLRGALGPLRGRRRRSSCPAGTDRWHGAARRWRPRPAAGSWRWTRRATPP